MPPGGSTRDHSGGLQADVALLEDVLEEPAEPEESEEPEELLLDSLAPEVAAAGAAGEVDVVDPRLSLR